MKKVQIKYSRPKTRVRQGRAQDAPQVEVQEAIGARCHICGSECDGQQLGNGVLRLRCPQHKIVVLEWTPPVFQVEPPVEGEPDYEPPAPLGFAELPAQAMGNGKKIAMAVAGAAALAGAAAQFFGN